MSGVDALAATGIDGAGAVSTWTELWPEGAATPEWSHSGAAVLTDGRLLFAAPGGHALIALDESSGAAERVETPTEDGHGLTVSSVEGREIVWIADPGTESGGRVLRLDWASGSVVALPDPLEGDPLSEAPSPIGLLGPLGPWRPTSTAVAEAPGAHFGDLWVADGYGRSLVHRYGVDGTMTTFDGSSSGAAFDCPHGIAIDDRGSEPLVVVADRLHSRLVFFDLDGGFVRSVTSGSSVGPAAMTRPSSLAVRGEDLLVTDLVGALIAVDPTDRVRAILPAVVDAERDGWPNAIVNGVAVRPELVPGRLNSPHGLAVGASGQVYLTEWLLGGRQVRLDLAGPAIASP